MPYAGIQKILLALIRKIQNMANRAIPVVLQDPLQSVSEQFDVASMAVFCKYINTSPFLELSRIVLFIVQQIIQKRRYTAW